MNILFVHQKKEWLFVFFLKYNKNGERELASELVNKKDQKRKHNGWSNRICHWYYGHNSKTPLRIHSKRGDVKPWTSPPALLPRKLLIRLHGTQNERRFILVKSSFRARPTAPRHVAHN